MDIQLTPGQITFVFIAVFTAAYIILVFMVGSMDRDYKRAFIVVTTMYIIAAILLAALYGLSLFASTLPL